MRILHTSDWHLGKNLEGLSRMEEQELFLKDFIDIVEEKQVDLVIIAGDVYDSPNPPAKAEKMFYDTLKKLSAHGERLTLVIAGNHDNPERLVAAGPLARDHGIIMVGTPKTIVAQGDYGRHRVIDSGEGFVEVDINGEKAVILTVPYPSEKRLNEVLYDAMDEEEERLKIYGDKIKLLFDNLSEKFREDTINIVVSHLFATGSEESGSERSIQLGGSFIVDGRCFPKAAQYIALGHIHKPQIVQGTDKRARYAGSPIHYNKKEIHFAKKCFIVDLKPQQEYTLEEVDFKVYKPIEIWKCESIEWALEECEKNKDRECWVYLEVNTDRYIREDEIKLMRSTKKDILEILPILSERENEEFVLDSFADKKIEDIFKEFYLKERAVEPQQEIVDLLLSIIQEQEGEETHETH
ncbi:Exodeoxyribonuclease I subunit D [Desulfitobacterium dehalogenans ATCC 51507]|uniref:Nuclease SbcCD subunit D n=1 Tax=Desulfitobacterium dehalogenans (strain ATCC 51507 / DSM 9161 / JW/IU-DC1) TaxID=756499 RepID=I4A549_DESDJ|nr:exonuclease SbcCD subunit D [Desulfitobacterium dehalogenans]AFL99083.1 Exodeoxyribonuclease I subunit D [Desulfitobacterium dehalogenans ATCC 51507]